MNSELLSLTEWFNANKLSLNISKTNYMVFCPKRMQIDTVDDNSCFLIISNEQISEKNSVKFLGIHLDKHLEWTEHYKGLQKKT